MSQKVTKPAFDHLKTIAPVAKEERVPELKHVQDHLERFGYLVKGSYRPGLLCKTTSNALNNYQIHHGQEKTGCFDLNTRSQMTNHRCGLPDMREGIEFSTRCAWNKSTLTFAFDGGSNDISGTGDFEAVRNAFKSWSDVAPLRFTEVGLNDSPDIVIDWRPADDPDHSMVGGVLAHADFPPDCGVVTNGGLPKPVHFDDEEHVWSIGAKSNAFDIETVAVHEIGHILGLQHSDVRGSVMFSSVSSNTTNRGLTADDIAGIRELYRTWVSVISNSPVWSDGLGWADVSNYSTIQTAVAGGELYLLARADRGMVTFRLDVDNNRWVSVVSNSPAWSDELGWADVRNYSTIQTAIVNDQLYLLARADRGMVTFRLDVDNNRWVSVVSNSPAWSDELGWADVRNYSTIQTAIVNDQLYLLARADRGMVTFRLDVDNNRWISVVSNSPAWSDALGWGDVRNYSTIQTAVVNDQLYLLARADRGMVTFRLDIENNRWISVVSNSPAWSDALGWGDVRNYSTIQTAVVNDQLYLLARADRGMVTFRLDVDSNRWVSVISNSPAWSDALGWGDVRNYSTIQTAVINDQLYLLARADRGMVTFRLDVNNNRWIRVADNFPQWSDALGWADVTNYSTIQTDVRDDNLYLLARANRGIVTYRLDA